MAPAIGDGDGTVLVDDIAQRLRGDLHLVAQVGELDWTWT